MTDDGRKMLFNPLFEKAESLIRSKADPVSNVIDRSA
jgi:hypothetical protein